MKYLMPKHWCQFKLKSLNPISFITQFGKVAVDLVAQEKFDRIDRMVAWQYGKVVTVSLKEVISQGTVLVNPQDSLIQTAQSLSTYMGEIEQ